MFADDGVDFFRSIAGAAGHLEAIDVENGEYEAFFTPGRERLLAQVLDDRHVALTPSGVTDLDALRSLLRRERQEREDFTSDPDDPVAVANEVSMGKWSIRWPMWPWWSDGRLHGSAPPRV